MPPPSAFTPPPAAVPEIAGLTLVLGGARAGKSEFAERLIAEHAPHGRAVYLATAEARAGDPELRARIARHRERRGGAWRTLEESLEVPRVVREDVKPDEPLLLECLTLWLARLLEAGREPELEAAALAAALEARSAPAVLVTNEVGLGLVSADAASRHFRDEAGLLHQRLAARAERVVFVAAGIPLTLKPAAR